MFYKIYSVIGGPSEQARETIDAQFINVTKSFSFKRDMEFGKFINVSRGVSGCIASIYAVYCRCTLYTVYSVECTVYNVHCIIKYRCLSVCDHQRNVLENYILLMIANMNVYLYSIYVKSIYIYLIQYP